MANHQFSDISHDRGFDDWEKKFMASFRLVRFYKYLLELGGFIKNTCLKLQ